MVIPQRSSRVLSPWWVIHHQLRLSCCQLRFPSSAPLACSFSSSTEFSSVPSLPPMVRRHIPNETKELALSMSLQGTSDLEIRKLTGISERSVKRLRRTHRNSGSVACKPVAPGRPRTLSSMEVKVRRVYLSHLPPQLILFPLLFSFFVIVSSGSLTCRAAGRAPGSVCR
jgi:hypothetical protein